MKHDVNLWVIITGFFFHRNCFNYYFHTDSQLFAYDLSFQLGLLFAWIKSGVTDYIPPETPSLSFCNTILLQMFSQSIYLLARRRNLVPYENSKSREFSFASNFFLNFHATTKTWPKKKNVEKRNLSRYLNVNKHNKLNIFIIWAMNRLLFTLQRTRGVLGHQEPTPPISDHHWVGKLVCFCLQQGQPQSPLQHERIWMQDPT